MASHRSNRGWRGASGEILQLSIANHAALERVVALDHPTWLDSDATSLHRRAIIVFAGDGRVQLVWPSEKGNLGVAQFNQVPDGCVNTGAVVQQDGADFASSRRNSASTIGMSRCTSSSRTGSSATKTEYGHTLHLALQHAADAVGQNGWVAIRGTDQDLVSVGDRDLFKTLDQFREEGLVMFSTMMPKRRLRPETRARAWEFGK